MRLHLERRYKKRKNLTFAQKLEIVKLIDCGETKRSVGEKFDVNESRVRGIYQKREHIKNHMNIAASKAASQALHGHNQLFLKTEQLSGRYLDRQAERNMAFVAHEIMDTAKAIYSGLARKLCVCSNHQSLASKGWVDKFMAHHKIECENIRCGGKWGQVSCT